VVSKNEAAIYPDIILWLGGFLGTRFHKAEIDIQDTHAYPLNTYVRRHNLHQYFQGDTWQTYDIRVDITGFVRYGSSCGLVFVECKTRPISLIHVSQILGYSRVAQPIQSYLISTVGIGDAVRSLILRYDRTDVLEYYWERGRQPRRIIVARWESDTRQLDQASILPPGSIG